MTAKLIRVWHTIQVLGLTNYSHWKEAAPVRQCLQGSQTLQQLVSSLALKQLQRFVHVGVMDMLDESIEAIAVRPQFPLSFFDIVAQPPVQRSCVMQQAIQHGPAGRCTALLCLLSAY
jgi:hypothetical protein